ncbi:MAG TPA: hypothetical protein VFB80_12650 [Pirellulaceae bacterium]|nr:hypothetical protein [Pirellulaceae bacterium]
MRDKLCRMVARFGAAVIDDARRCEALLKDFCPEDRREVHVLMAAVREQVAADLVAPTIKQKPAAAIGRLTKRLEENLGLSAEAARWAVESWALALGVVKPQQLAAARPQKPPAPAVAKQVAAPPVIVKRPANAIAPLKSPRRGWLIALSLAALVLAPGAGVGLAWSSGAMRGMRSRTSEALPQRQAVEATTPAAMSVESSSPETAEPPERPAAIEFASALAVQPRAASMDPISPEEEQWVRDVLKRSAPAGSAGRDY